MLSVEQFNELFDRLHQTDLKLSEEIQRITSKIAAHREDGRSRVASLSSDSGDRHQYHTWRRISCHLHQRRSRLKTEQENTRRHLKMVRQRLEELSDEFLNFQLFQDAGLESEPASVGA